MSQTGGLYSSEGGGQWEGREKRAEEDGCGKGERAEDRDKERSPDSDRRRLLGREREPRAGEN